MLSVCVKDNKSHSTRHALWVLLCALVLTLYHGLTRCVCTMRGHGVWARCLGMVGRWCRSDSSCSEGAADGRWTIHSFLRWQVRPYWSL